MNQYLKLKNCIKICVIPIKVPYELDFKELFMKLLHCLSMFIVNVIMSPFPQFAHMDWNEVKLKF
jgi:hypothetical protein